MYVLQLNRRFTFNWIAMFVVTLSQRTTYTCYITDNAPAPFLSVAPPPAPNTVHSAILRYSHIARYLKMLRHVMWTMGIDVSKAYISCIFCDKMPDGGNSFTHLPDYTASIPDYSIHTHCAGTAGSSSRPHQPQEADSRSSGSACAPPTLHIVTTGHTTFPRPLNCQLTTFLR